MSAAAGNSTPLSLFNGFSGTMLDECTLSSPAMRDKRLLIKTAFYYKHGSMFNLL